MAKPRTNAHPWTLKVLAILDDYEWHDYKAVLEEAADLVPPGMAWRKAEYYREYHFKKVGRPILERKNGDRNDTIRTGQRLVVGRSIKDLHRAAKDRVQRIEVEYDDPNKKRKKPVRIRRLR